jgi:hypothetical protein
MDTDCVWLTDSDMARLQEQEKSLSIGILLEAYVMGLSGLGWQYNPLV